MKITKETVSKIDEGVGGGVCPCGENCQCGSESPCKGNNAEVYGG
jgi:hypothetical protein